MIETIEVPCPKCRKNFKQKVSGMQNKKNITCPKCGALIDASEVARGIKSAMNQLAEIDRDFRKLSQ